MSASSGMNVPSWFTMPRILLISLIILGGSISVMDLTSSESARTQLWSLTCLSNVILCLDSPHFFTLSSLCCLNTFYDCMISPIMEAAVSPWRRIWSIRQTTPSIHQEYGTFFIGRIQVLTIYQKAGGWSNTSGTASKMLSVWLILAIEEAAKTLNRHLAPKIFSTPASCASVSLTGQVAVGELPSSRYC